ncbi:Nucleotide-binding oligomerization domain-containing protein 2 [Hondaea fermentalgiana]|uniref:Nucleotide-binding oligomerization domain-containing protein 2 n=1 Tax=Hondaea fermentalgiana TaxID=2315210 RepID=A0A2R5GWX8_9STRA|nr:Nucleotide-binding oligomerization domain-containing protein 2 [Hondaea fermentalgiana]|eukprot:GBG34278.1 Nucleotide-binding oligomerization domain-containing protein 2 [Hondaea fermentalgiana]
MMQKRRLVNCRIGVDGAKALAGALVKNSSLQTLELQDNEIGDGGAKALADALAKNSSLQTLSLSHNYIVDGGAKALADALAKNSSLQTLGLEHNQIGSDGSKALAFALTKISSLQTLGLNTTNIDDVGAKALAYALAKNPSLQTLMLRDNNIGDDGAKALADALANNTCLLTYLDLNTWTFSDRTLTRIGIPRDELRKEAISGRSTAAHEAHDALKANGKVRWGRAKLMVVGKVAAGKTSTIRTLLSQPYNPDHDSTIGVELKLTHTRDWKERKCYGDADLGEQIAKYVHLQLAIVKNRLKRLSDGDLRHPTPPRMSTSSSASNVSFDEREIAKAVSTPLRLHIKKQADKPDEEISFTIWDYGGQEVFYALHHLFLTQYGVYVLVFDMREVLGKKRFKERLDEREYAKLASQEDSLETFRFWIDSIRLHAPDANIALVGTYLDQVPDSEEHEEIEYTLETEVLRRCGVKSVVLLNDEAQLWFFPIDNADRDYTNNRARALRESLSKAVIDKDFVKEKVPLRWSYCLEKLLSQDKDYLLLNEVEKLATTECHISKEDVFKMLKYMHELGVLVHLTTGQDDVLRQIVVIRPQWLLKNLSRVICDSSMNHMHRHKKKLLHQGKLPRKLRDSLDNWSERGVSSRDLLEWLWQGQPVDYLVELMHAMLLACPSPWINDADEEGALLIPSLLQPVKDDVRTEALCGLGEQRALAYIEFEVLPKGVFQRFIASLIQSLPGLVGVRNGVVFSNFARIAFDNVDVILETEASGRRVMLHFKKPANKSLKSHVKILQHCLDSIDASFMRGNLGPKLFLSSDGSDSGDACASVDAFADATNNEVPSLQRGKRLSLALFSPFVEDGEAARGLHSSDTSDPKPFDVFLSHAWGENKGVHEKVKSIAGALESRGIRCWLDEKDIGTEILDSMADGIDRCKAIAVFVTQEYMRKVNKGRTEFDNCRDEFCYALQRVKPAGMIPCVLEKEMVDKGTWEGRFGISWSGNPLYVRMLNGGQPDEVDALACSIRQVIGLQEEAMEPLRAETSEKEEAEVAEKTSITTGMAVTRPAASIICNDNSGSNVKSAEMENDDEDDEQRELWSTWKAGKSYTRR